MNHRLYEDWLFIHLDPNAGALTAQQAADLHAHVQQCASCQRLASSWRETDVELRRRTMVEPAPGFSTRWQARLEADRKRLHQRQSLLVLAFYMGAAFLVMGSLLALLWPWLGSPEVVFWTWFYRMFTLASYAEVLQGFLRTFFQVAAGSVSPTFWMFFVGILSEVAVLWVVSFRLITNPRRVSK